MRWLVLLAVVACGSDSGDRARPPAKPARAPGDAAAKPESRIAAIGDTSLLPADVRRALDPAIDFSPPHTPGPDDWLTQHPETPQTFDDYINSEFHVPTDQRRTIYLLPLGTFTADAPSITALSSIVHAYFTLDVKVLAAVPIAEVTAKTRINDSTHKRQLLASDILAWLTKRIPDDAYALMAVTMDDLYPEPKWNYVFGMASLQERVGIQSFARQDPAFFGDPRGAGWKQLAFRRATWTLVHEISHMFGMQHCVHFACVVAGSNHQAEADLSPLHPCPVCLHKLWWTIRFDPAKREAELAKALRELGIDDEAAWSERRAKWIRDGTR